MIDVADIKAGPGTGALHLRMAFEAEIHIALDEHFCIHGAVRVMANRATFPERGVLEDERPRLFPVALRAAFVQARHGQAARGFHDVHAVGIVALDAVHFAFDDRMMLRQMKFSAGFLVALEAALGILSWVNDEFFQSAASGHGDVFAAGTMAGFAAVLPGHLGVFDPQPRVWAGWKNA